MAYVVGADRDGNPIMFDPDTGSIIPVPPPPEPPPPPPPGTTPPASSPPPGGLVPQPGVTPVGGGCFTQLSDVYRWFIKYLGGPPHSDAEAIGYGRIGLPCDQVELEIFNSPEAIAFSETGITARPLPKPQPGTVAPAGPATACPAGQHKLFGVGPCIVDTIGPELPPELAQVLQEILAELGTLTDGATKDVHTIADDVVAKLEGKDSPLLADLQKIIDQVKALAGSAIGSLPSDVAQLVGSAFGGVESLVAAFLANAANVDDVAGAAVKAVKGQKGGLFEFLLGLIMTGGSALAAQTLGALQDAKPAPPPTPPRTAVTGGELAAEVQVPFTPVSDPRDPLGPIAAGLENGLGAILGMLAILEPGGEVMKQFAWGVSPTKLVDSGAAVSAEVRSFITPDVAEELSRRDGFNSYMHAIERELAKARPDTGALFDAWHRDEIKTDELTRGLARLGFDQEARNVLIAVARRLLGIDAMARLSDRDLARLGGSATFSGIDEITPEFVREGLNSGLSDDDINRAWELHYQPPDTGTAAELLHRGAIPIEAYRAALRANAVPPQWRAAYEVAAFVPYSRRDWLRLVKLDLIDHAGLVRTIMDNGYDERRAEILAQMFEKLGKDDTAAAKKALQGPISRDLLALYEAGARGRDIVEPILAELKLDQDEIHAMISEADLHREVARIGEVTRLVRPLYVQGAWDWPRSSNELTQWGIDESHQAELKREWDLARALLEDKPHQQRAHELTVAELTTAFIDREITEADYRDRLLALRFSPRDADLEIVLAQTKQHKAEQADLVAQIEHDLLAGNIDEPTASDRLDHVGVAPGRRDRLLDTWLKTRASRRVELTVAQLTSLLSEGIIDDADLHDYMLQLPYGEKERIWLEALVGSKAAAAQARALAQAAKAARTAAAAATVAGP